MFIITDNEKLATQTRTILENGLPAAVVLSNPQRIKITSIVKDLYSGGEVVNIRVVTEPTLVRKGKPVIIRRVYGEGTSTDAPHGEQNPN
ncbi:MAG: hypothetical protein HY515_04835 [Candidatus Aenigmarchaeota archaeon]|nr:hypothetical protein [Candidatus Aenigmarchaeota archaeon]